MRNFFLLKRQFLPTENGGYRHTAFKTLEVFKNSLGDATNTRSVKLDSVQVDLDTFFENILETRTSIGGRLNALISQRDDNEAFILTTQKTLSSIRDVDLEEAISQLTLEQTTLEAAQAVFARISSSSLFNFLR